MPLALYTFGLFIKPAEDEANDGFYALNDPIFELADRTKGLIAAVRLRLRSGSRAVGGGGLSRVLQGTGRRLVPGDAVALGRLGVGVCVHLFRPPRRSSETRPRVVSGAGLAAPGPVVARGRGVSDLGDGGGKTPPFARTRPDSVRLYVQAALRCGRKAVEDGQGEDQGPAIRGALTRPRLLQHIPSLPG